MGKLPWVQMPGGMHRYRADEMNTILTIQRLGGSRFSSGVGPH